MIFEIRGEVQFVDEPNQVLAQLASKLEEIGAEVDFKSVSSFDFKLISPLALSMISILPRSRRGSLVAHSQKNGGKVSYTISQQWDLVLALSIATLTIGLFLFPRILGGVALPTWILMGAMMLGACAYFSIALFRKLRFEEFLLNELADMADNVSAQVA